MGSGMARVILDEITRRTIMVNVFDRSYRFYPTAAPYPGICLTCSNVTNLWDLGIVKTTNQGAYLCDTCLKDLALYAGFVLKTTHETAVTELTNTNEQLKAQLDVAPNLVKELTNDINSVLGNFVTSLAGITVTSKPVQPESVEASTGSVEGSNDVKPATGKAKGSGVKSSA